VWAAVKRAAAGAWHTAIDIADDASTNHYFFAGFNDTNNAGAAAAAGGSGSIAVTSTTLGSGAVGLIECRHISATDRRARLNGAGEGTNTTSLTPAGIDRYAIGSAARSSAANFLNGDFLAAIVAAGTPTVGERNLVHDWLALAHGGSYTPISA